jgi:hypothetical protein
MAQLKRAEDGHLYIIAGQSQGTWQLYDTAEAWLRSHGYHIPSYGKKTILDAGTYRYLRDKRFLYIKNISYQSKSITESSESFSHQSQTSLTLFLQLETPRYTSWSLKIDLSELVENDNIWNELQRNQAKKVHISGAVYPPIALKRLYTPYFMKVSPQISPLSYRYYWLDHNNNKQELRTAPRTPGLLDNWQGNVFVKHSTTEGLWERILTPSSISFSDTILWLAKVGHDPKWVSDATQTGSPIDGWQLWQLDIDEEASVVWEDIKKWFSYRDIAILPLYQPIHLINPLGTQTPDGRYRSTMKAPIFVETRPSTQRCDGITRTVKLASMPFDNNNLHKIAETLINTVTISTEQINYFRWYAPKPGSYRICLKGDASTKLLDIHVHANPLPTPSWLKGLTCTAQSSAQKQVISAFSASIPIDEHVTPPQLACFTCSELATLSWSYEPSHLPVKVCWRYFSAPQTISPKHQYIITTGSELTRCWRERIWPQNTDNRAIHLILDAGSFGLIELQVIPSTEPEVESEAPTLRTWLTDRCITAQLLWYSQVIVRNTSSKQIKVPTSLRYYLGQLRREVEAQSALFVALERLMGATTMPRWLLPRVQRLVTKIQHYPIAHIGEQ